ncbi:MAG: hypothetical protein LBQ42_07815, partial [Synergistaceae bacterium]|nr:hypothetical protein [Synergistaceae bacterium]
YTQDDGTLRVAFVVPSLQNTQGSNLWGMNSPYMTTPDPGLLLPNRYTWSGGTLVTNTASNALQIRGAGFTNYTYNALPTNTKETVAFRIFNYSFQNAAALTYDVYYQPMNSGTDQPDITKATKIASASDVIVPAIPGRSNNANAPDNWHDASFQWTTPSVAGNGFLHIVLKYGGTQLSAANDSGYFEVGIYDANEFLGLSGANAINANALLDTRAALEADGAKLSVVTVMTDEEGNEIQGSLPLDKPFKIAATVRLDGLPDGRSGLPIVKVNLYANGIPVGSKHIPYLASGQSRTIEMDYDPSDHAEIVKLKSLKVLVFSEATGFKRNGEDALSASVEIDFAENKGGGGHKGSSGCNAGAAGLMGSLAALGAVLRTRKKRGV